MGIESVGLIYFLIIICFVLIIGSFIFLKDIVEHNLCMLRYAQDKISFLQTTLKSNNIKYKTKELPLTVEATDVEGYQKVKQVEEYYENSK